MGGKKPIGEHPSRGSHFRRFHSSRGGHHHSSDAHSHLLQPAEQSTYTPSFLLDNNSSISYGGNNIGDRGGVGDIPNYQDFSLFSAFTSSDGFGGILTSDSNANTTSALSPPLPNEEHDLEPGRLDKESRDAFIDSDKDFSGEKGEQTAQISALKEQNTRLEDIVQQLQVTVENLSLNMDRLSYEHSLVVQQLQQAWHFMHSQSMQARGYGQGHGPGAGAGAGAGAGGGGDGRGLKKGGRAIPSAASDRGDSGGEASSPAADTTQSPVASSTAATTATATVSADSTISEELRRVKERLCTAEGRQRAVQGRVSQLDKLYGTSSAAWGRSIKGILQQQVALNEAGLNEGLGGVALNAGKKEGTGGVVARIEAGKQEVSSEGSSIKVTGEPKNVAGGDCITPTVVDSAETAAFSVTESFGVADTTDESLDDVCVSSSPT